MFVTMVIAALDRRPAVQRARPDPRRPARRHDDIFGSIELDYKLVLDVIALVVFAALFYLTVRRSQI